MVNFDQMWFIFNIVSPAVHTLLPSVLRRLNFYGIEALILILKKVLNCRYNHIIGPASQSSIFHDGEQNVSQIVPNQENMEGDFKTSSKQVTHSS